LLTYSPFTHIGIGITTSQFVCFHLFNCTAVYNVTDK
jgi:hypothetical protein